MNELTNSPPADDAPASRGAGGAGTDMMSLLSSMVSVLINTGIHVVHHTSYDTYCGVRGNADLDFMAMFAAFCRGVE